MRLVIEKSLQHKADQTKTKQEHGHNGTNDSRKAYANDPQQQKESSQQYQQKQHYESSCVVESKSYFGNDFDSEKHNSELMYEDLPKPITELNKSKPPLNGMANGKSNIDMKTKEYSR